MIGTPEPDMTLADARRIAADGFVFGFPVVLVDAVRRTHPIGLNQVLRLPEDSSAIAPGLAGDDPHMARSSAWVDLSQGPVRLTLPDLEARHCSVTIYDAWGRLQERLEARELEPVAPKMALIGPDWSHALPSGFTARRLQTNLAWIVVRLALRTPDDRDDADQLLAGQSITPLEGEPFPIQRLATVEAPHRSSSDWVYGLDPQRYFHRLAMLLERHPPSGDVRAIISSLARIGVIAGEEFRPPAGQSVQEALAHGLLDGHARVRHARTEDTDRVDGWFWAAPSSGDLPADLARAAAERLGAAAPEDSLRLTCHTDADGLPLTGSERYGLQFAAGEAPPVDGFWTLKLGRAPRSDELKQRRLALSDRDDLTFAADGSLELLIQHAPPDALEAGNWLPAPPGPFSLCLHLYWPNAPALSGAWRPPSPRRLDARPRLAAGESRKDKEHPQ